jgi:2-amino-4-hydroxy-6-hydroxymethyldihydropteridine diphosphokinase
MPVCLVGLGSNRGPRRQTLQQAMTALATHPHVRVLAASAWRATQPVGGPPGQPPFLNGALTLETSLDPRALLAALQGIEAALGRRRAERWGPRPIDLDLLLYGELVLTTPELVLPHPRMAWRRFVLEPAAEVAPSMVHPTTGWTIARLLEHLNSALPYVALAGPIGVGKSHLAASLARRGAVEHVAEEVDSDRLARFYANPSGNAWEVEIEFLRQRGRLLAAGDPRWSDRRRTVVSDFWLEQSLSFAGVWLPPDRQAAFDRVFEDVRRTVVEPKLIVLLDAPIEDLLERVRRNGRPGEQGLEPETLERIRQAIVARANAPGHGPVLRLTYGEPQQALEEVLAAVESMK